MINDPVLLSKLNPCRELDRNLLGLIDKGLVEYWVDEMTGDLVFNLTAAGEALGDDDVSLPSV
jgi:hypothetical protein